MTIDRHRRRRWLVQRAPVAVALAATACLLGALPASAKTQAEIDAETAPPVAGTPCTANAKACVDVNNHKAWLIKDGKIFRGPVPISTGGKGKDTPTGNVFRVYRKDQNFKSTEFKMPNGQPAPMPYAVFFEDGGIAFHSGNPRLASAGCVHLSTADAIAFFNYLQLEDHVQVMNGPVAAKPLTPEQLAAANGGVPADYEPGGDGPPDYTSDAKHKRDSDDEDSDDDSASKDRDSDKKGSRRHSDD